MGIKFSLKSSVLKVNFREKRIVLGAIFNFLTKVTTLITLLVVTPLTFKYLGDERYGVFMVIMSFISILSFSDLGLGYGLLNKLMFNTNKADKDLLEKKYISSTFFFLCLIAILGILFLIFLFKFINFNNYFNIRSSLAYKEAQNATLIFFTFFLVSLPFSIVSKIQISNQESFLNDLWLAFGNITSIFAMLFVIYKKYDLSALVLANYGVKSIILILQFYYELFIKKRNLFPSLFFFDFNTFKSIFSLGVVFFFLQFSSMLLASFDTILVSKNFSVRDLAVFVLVQRLFYVFTAPLQSLASPFLPAINDAISKNDFFWIKKTLKNLFYFLIGASLIQALIFLFWADKILLYWIDNNLIFPPFLLLAFSLYFFVSNGQDFISPILSSPKHIKFQVILIPICSVVVLFFKYIFINKINIGQLQLVNFFGVLFIYIIPSLFYLSNKYFK